MRAPSPGTHRDRKSTRLNSSHLVISYAVFCLKKKKKKKSRPSIRDTQQMTCVTSVLRPACSCSYSDGCVFVSRLPVHSLCFLFFFFFFKESGAPQDLPSSPPRPSSD